MKKTEFNIDLLLAAILKDSKEEDALIAQLDRDFEAAKAAGTLPNTDADFELFWHRWTTYKDPVSVVFRRYLMASGQSQADIVATFQVSEGLVEHLMELRRPFFPDDVNRLAKRLARDTDNPVGAVVRLLKELAAHHYARVSRGPALLAARTRRP